MTISCLTKCCFGGVLGFRSHLAIGQAKTKTYRESGKAARHFKSYRQLFGGCRDATGRYRQRQWYKPICDGRGRRLVGGRIVSAKASNGMRSSAHTLGPFRSVVTHHARRSTSCPRLRRPHRAPQHGCGVRFHFRWLSSRHLLVAVMVTPPDALFVAPFGGAV